MLTRTAYAGKCVRVHLESTAVDLHQGGTKFSTQVTRIRYLYKGSLLRQYLGTLESSPKEGNFAVYVLNLVRQSCTVRSLLNEGSFS